VRRTVRDLPVEVIEADGRTALTGPLFDRVLVDAPCTGLGVIRRRAEARWRRTPADVGTLAALQRELLTAALAAVRPGGLVLYSTCSPHLAETEQVVADVVRKVSGVERVAISLTAEDEPSVDARLWPHVHGTDGMYAALLRVPTDSH
jgi:16S rRNA (cytosine967-C5)-methyltransferase